MDLVREVVVSAMDPIRIPRGRISLGIKNTLSLSRLFSPSDLVILHRLARGNETTHGTEYVNGSFIH